MKCGHIAGKTEMPGSSLAKHLRPCTAARGFPQQVRRRFHHGMHAQAPSNQYRTPENRDSRAKKARCVVFAFIINTGSPEVHDLCVGF